MKTIADFLRTLADKIDPPKPNARPVYLPANRNSLIHWRRR